MKVIQVVGTGLPDMPNFRAILAGAVLLFAAWIALTPFLKLMEEAFSVFRGKPNTSRYAIFPGPLIPSVLLGISYLLYAPYAWARKVALATLVIDLSFIAWIFVAIVWQTYIEPRLTKNSE
jgi:hypothetical protein